MSKSKVAKKTDKSTKTISAVVTHEQAKEYLQKLEKHCFVGDDEDDSEGLVIADGDYFTNDQLVTHFGYDSDNDDTILRGENGNGNGSNASIGDNMNDSPDFYDSDEDNEITIALKNKYRSMQKN